MTGSTDTQAVDGSVVVLGNFNPRIFHPAWLAENGVIGRREAENATSEADVEIEVVHRQLTVLQLSTLRLEVTLNRFFIQAREAPLILARDFALKCFSLLSHTPVSQAGLNFGVLFRPRSRVAWDAFGDTLAPKQLWKELLGDMKDARTGGLTHMRMERSERADGFSGQQSVTIQIADRLTMDTKIDFNDHYELGSKNPMGILMDILETRWEAAQAESTRIADALRSLCREP